MENAQLIMEKLLIIILVIGLTKYSSAEDKTESETKPYDTKFDNIDIDDLLKNDRLLKNYVKCLEYEGPCTPDGKMLRGKYIGRLKLINTLKCLFSTDILPDALLTKCEKCSERQKFASEKVIHYLIDERKDYWSELEKIYDQDGSYRNHYLLEKLASIDVTTSGN